MSDTPERQIAESVAPDFVEKTRTIHTWCHWGAVSTDKLIAELKYWAEYLELRQEQERHHA